MKNIFSRGLAVLTVIAMLFIQITPAFADNVDVEPLENKGVTVSLGIPGIRITAEYGESKENAVTGETGSAVFPGLYSYLITKGFTLEPTGEDIPALTEDVSFNINYDGMTVTERHYQEGNTLYTGKTEHLEVKSNNDWLNLSVGPLDEEPGFIGFVYKVEKGKTEKEAVPAHGITVISGDETCISGEDGFYFFNSTEGLRVEETDDYTAASESDPKSPTTLYIWEKFDAASDMYKVTPEWANAGTKEVTVICEEEYTISNGGAYSNSTKLDVGSIEKLTLKDSLGHISRPFNVEYKKDIVPPRIVNTEVSAEGVELTSHGVYGKTYASFTIAATVEEKESGISKISLVGKDTEYPLIDGAASEGGYTAVYRIDKGEEVLKDTLKIVAEDKAGNKSEAKLIRDTEDESTLILENLPPEVSEIEISNDGKQESGWYIESPTITVKGKDIDSGLKKVVAEINGTEVYSKTYDKKVLSEEAHSFEIPEELLNKADTSYLIRVVFTDNAGSSNIKSRTIKVDRDPPEVTIEGVNDGDILKTASTLKVSVNENYSGISGEKLHVVVEYTNAIDQTKEVFNEAYSGEKEAVISRDVFSLDGVYKVTVTARDPAGNETSESLSFTKDSEAPFLEIKDITGEKGLDDWYITPVKMAFSCGDITTEVKSVKRYINDKELEGSAREIDLTEELYNELKNEDGTYIFKVVCEDTAGNLSEIKETFKVDVHRPEVSFEGVAQGSVYKSVPEIKINVDDEHLKETRVYLLRPESNEAEERVYDGQTEIIIPDIESDGIYAIRAIATDEAGNISKEVAASFTVDKTAPEITSLGVDKEPNDAGWYSDELTYSYEIKETVSGLKSVKAFVNDKEVKTEDGKVVLNKDIISSTENEKGEYVVRIVAETNAGVTFDISETYKIDLLKPEITLSGIDDGKVYNTPPTLKIDTKDSHTSDIVVLVERDNLSISTETFKGKSQVEISSFKEDGKYALRVKAIDYAGNVSDEGRIEFTLDKTAPELTSKGVKETANDLGWYAGEITYTFDVKDNLSGLKGIKAYINDKEVETSNGEVRLSKGNIKDLDKGSSQYTFKITAEDKAGNKSEIKETYRVDVIRPEIELSNIQDGAVYTKAPNLNIKVNDRYITERGGVIRAEVKRDGKVIKSPGYNHVDNASINEFSEDGIYEITSYAIDPAGNTSESKKITFTVDSTNPFITEVGVKEGEPNFGGWYNSPITYEFKVEDKTSGIKNLSAKLNGKDVDINSNSVNISRELIEETINPTGTYTIELSATDKAGNELIFAKTFKIDALAPNVSLSGVSDGDNYMNSPTLTVNNDEKHYSETEAFIAYEISRNGASQGVKRVRSSKSIPISEFVEDGHYEVVVYAKDAAGNTSSEKRVSFTKDSTKPVIRTFDANTPANGNGWYSGPVTFSVLAEDNTAGISKLTATVNGTEVPVTNGEIILTRDIIERLANDSGTYAVRFVATDSSGNEATEEKLLKIDIASPGVNFSGAEEGKMYKEAPTLSVGSTDKFSSDRGHIIHVDILRDGSSVSSEDFSGTSSVTLNRFAEDGLYTVKYYAKDAAGNRSEEKTLSFSKDGTAPVITISGVAQDEWNKEGAMPTVSITEKFFDTAEAVLTLTREMNGQNVKVPFGFTFTGVNSRSTANLTESGRYTLTVTAKDSAGNEAERKTISFYVDVKPPTVTVSGLEKKVFGYKDVFAPSVSYIDEYLDTVEYTLTRGGIDWKEKVEITNRDGRIIVSSIPKQHENDGVYILTVNVKDKAGNVTQEVATWTVNRFGSYYEYGKYAESIKGTYVREITEDLVIDEFNISQLTDVTAELKLDGKVIKSTVDRKESTRDNETRTSHIFASSNFRQEGVYELNVLSKDQAGNSMESRSENGDLKFTVDRTPPVIMTSGIERRVEGNTYDILISATDTASPNVKLEVTLDGMPLEGEEREDGTLITVGAGGDRALKILATDLAGNSSLLEKMISVVPKGEDNSLLGILGKILPYTGVGIVAALLLLVHKFFDKKSK